MGFQKKKEEEKQEKPRLVVPATAAEKFALLFNLSQSLDKERKTENTLIRLGSQVGKPIPSIPTGFPTFDIDAMGVGGVPRGRVIEIFGPESAGKTTIALQIIAAAQSLGDIAAFVDAEHALDPTYAKVLGVNVDDLLVSQPNNGEEALDTVIHLVKTGCVGVIVVDSVSALVPESELAGEITDASVGVQARMMSKAMRMLVGECSRTSTTVIFINQIREKIGVMFGNPETTTGGRALKFYSSIRIDVRRREPLRWPDVKTGDIVGHELELKCIKNKCSTPYRSTILRLYYPKTRFTPGLDRIGDLMTFASGRNLFTMKGSWYWLDVGNKEPDCLGNGYDKVRAYLESSPRTVEVLKSKIAGLLAVEVKV